MIWRESDGIIILTFGGLERPDQGHLLKNRFSGRDSAIATIKHVQGMLWRKSNDIIILTFGGLGRPDQGHLLKNRFSVRGSAIVTMKHV